MAKKDYYDVLSVDKNTSSDDIKKAYRKLARKYHPDINKEAGAETKFKEIQEAYSVLGDKEKRAAYDQFGHAGMEGFSQGGAGGFGFGGGGFADGFGDVFDMFFGGSGRRSQSSSGQRRGPSRGSDLRFDMQITLEDVFYGLEKEIKIPHLVHCDSCKGSGAAKGTSPKNCSSCGGTGVIRQEQRSLFGSFVSTTTCPNCHGEGKIISSPCSSCHGNGVIKKKDKVKVKIPAGVEDGTRLRISGSGDAGSNGGPVGDLYIYLYVSPHKTFVRRGNDLNMVVDIPFSKAVLGGEVDIIGMDGKLKLKIPEGTQSGTSLRLRDKGIPSLRGRARGALNVTLNIVTPRNLTREQKDLLTKFATLRKEL